MNLITPSLGTYEILWLAHKRLPPTLIETILALTGHDYSSGLIAGLLPKHWPEGQAFGLQPYIPIPHPWDYQGPPFKLGGPMAGSVPTGPLSFSAAFREQNRWAPMLQGEVASDQQPFCSLGAYFTGAEYDWDSVWQRHSIQSVGKAPANTCQSVGMGGLKRVREHYRPCYRFYRA